MKIFMLALFNLIHLKNSVSENVALFSRNKYCGDIELSFLLVDGITKKEKFFSLTSRCPSYAFLDIITAEPHVIHYAVVFKGEGQDSGQLKYFHVEVSDPTGNFVICGRHSSFYIPPDLGSRVNCKPGPATSTIRLRSHMNEGFILSEVEAHSLGEEGLDVLLYRGCFRSFDGEHKSAINEIGACLQTCKTRFSYIAMKGGTQCYCGNDYNTAQEIKATLCTIRCDDNTERICGSADSFSVYIANFRLPYFVGCYTYPSMSGNPIEGDMSIGTCLRHCDNSKFAFLTAGDKCYCENGRNGMEETREGCNTPCTGEGTMMCGADGEYSVYRTCYNPETKSLKCSQVIKCDLWNSFGECEDKKCKTGFTGRHCISRVYNSTFDVNPFNPIEYLKSLWSPYYLILPVVIILLIIGISTYAHFKTSPVISSTIGSEEEEEV